MCRNIYMFKCLEICVYVYMFICFGESRYQYIGMSYAMIVMLKDMIKEHLSCKSNTTPHMKNKTPLV